MDNWSTTVKMAVFPSERGRPVTKSKDTWDQGHRGAGSGLNNPDDAFFTVLIPCTSRACSDVFLNVLSPGGPPESVVPRPLLIPG